LSRSTYLTPQFRDFLPDYRFLLSVAAVAVALDQWTKWLIRAYLPLGHTWTPWEWLVPYARIVHWKNVGAAFGLFQGGGWVFAALAVVVAALILIYFPEIPRCEKYLRLALALQFGGAIGNLIDRLTRGWVTDFVSLGNFPVFNVADACISIGVALIVLSFLPHVPDEYARWAFSRRSRQINQRNPGRNHRRSSAGPTHDDPMTLGILEILLGDTAQFEPLILKLKAARIHHRGDGRSRGKAAHQRQPKAGDTAAEA